MPQKQIPKKSKAGETSKSSKNVPHFALCKGETIVQGLGIGPLDTTFVRPEDDPRKMNKEDVVNCVMG